MQQQMVTLNDERLDVLAQIDSLKASNEQIAIIQDQIAEERAAHAKEEKKLSEEVEKIQAKVTALKEEMRSEGDANRKKTWGEKKIDKLESELKEKVAESVNQDEAIESLTARISELKEEEAGVDEKLESVEARVKRYSAMQKKVGSLQPLTMWILELESRYASRMAKKRKVEGRIQNRTVVADKMEASNQALEEKVAQLNETLEALSGSRVSLNGKDQATEETLKEEQRQLDVLEEELRNYQERVSKEVKITEEETSKMKSEVDEVDATLKQLVERVESLTKSIEQSKMDHDILINKKVSLIEQLNKSIKEKVNDIIRARNNSPYVLRLIESQEKHWMERQKLYEVYSAVKARHKQVTDNGTRKALALTALKSWIQSLPPTGTNDPMSELNNAFQAAQTENKTLATQLARLQHELSLTQ